MLVLFDIDGTLLRCGPQVRGLFGDALREVFGTTGDLDGYDFSGKTDPRIVVDLITGAGIPREAVAAGLPRFRDLYTSRLDRGLERHLMVMLPAVEDVLGELERRADVTLGLLTGNWRRGAEIKLGRFGLERYFPFGAFGDDGEARGDLLPIALRRALDSTGIEFHRDDVVIVGDSVHDVRCGRSNGVRVVAVTTGWTPREALEEAGAQRVVDDLGEALAALG